MASAKNWITVAESSFPWERDALDFVRSRFPSHEPYRAWANFEFIADDGSINEVDLLVFAPQGFFLIEIKSRPGRLRGDAGTWTWETEGRPLATMDNPLLLANAKAKKLRSLLGQQKACKKKGQVPWLDALMFCSAPDLKFELQGNAAFGVCLRDTDARPGILAAIQRRECPGLREHPGDRYDKPAGKMVAQAMEQAGIRPSRRSRKVGDYILEQLIDQGPGYQDWQATHTTLKNVRRRVRIYNVRTGATEDERQTIERAARREAELLESLQHPGILRREGFTEHELGPALIFEHDPQSIRLDHFLAQRKDQLTIDQRLDLIRQIAEVIRFAHEKRVVHRALSPQSVLISPDDYGRLQVKIFNWQVGYRGGTTTSGVSRPVSATCHVDRLVDDASTAYMAPEAVSDTASPESGSVGEHLDVFSLGAIAYHLFAGQPPAANGLELSNRLRETRGLQISSVLNGAGENLQELIRWSTHADVGVRLDTASDFLELLEKVEDEATSPDQEKFVEDPNRAKKDDVLPENYRVVRRLGQGGCSVVLLVEKDGQEFVLKAASDPEHNARLREEAEILDKLRHNHIVEKCGTLEIGDRFAFLMRPVFAEKDDNRIETLRDRLRREGRLHVDLLQRFGEDLLDVVRFLEDEAGIPHRDIKPDNIAIGQIIRGRKLHLVLFDFSLSRAPAENIRAGTTGYLDPLLPLRKNKRWDLHAERYAAAATLYELAAGPGNLPKWGDGASDPSHLDCEATIDGDLFDASMRDALVEFFQRAFRRNPDERFDNAEQMLNAWRDCFAGIEQPGLLSEHEDEGELRRLLEPATFDTQIPELGLGTRATNALDRANILTVEDLLTVSIYSLNRLRGVGQKTRREISAAVRILRGRLGKPSRVDACAIDTTPEPDSLPADVGSLSVDLLTQKLLRVSSREGDTAQATVRALLGLELEAAERGLLACEVREAPAPPYAWQGGVPGPAGWPSQTEIATAVDVTPGRIGQLVGKFQVRWAKDPAITRIRTDVAEILGKAGGVMSVAELAEAILIARGSARDEPERTSWATAVARACVEVERTIAEPRYVVRRDHGRVFVARSLGLANYAGRLGDEADRLADEDPLVPPARLVQRLREVTVPRDVEVISDARIIRLAAAASRHAAVSSRQELYPRGMDAARALKLSQGALYGVPFLTVEQIRTRVSGRYPEANPLPDRPALDELLKAAGFDFTWDATAKGSGCYVSRLSETVSVTSGSESILRLPTVSPRGDAGEITPEIADARQFEERLQRGIKEGSFLTLLVHPKHYQRAAHELCERFPIRLVDFEGLFLDVLKDVADQAQVQWDLVLKTDAKPGEGDWDKLMMLVERAMIRVEQSLVNRQSSFVTSHLSLVSDDRFPPNDKGPTTTLLIYPGLLARYDQMDLLSRLAQKVGRADGIQSLWLLLPGDGLATIDGKPVPLLGPGQKTRIPESWLANVHRGTRFSKSKNERLGS